MCLYFQLSTVMTVIVGEIGEIKGIFLSSQSAQKDWNTRSSLEKGNFCFWIGRFSSQRLGGKKKEGEVRALLLLRNYT